MTPMKINFRLQKLSEITYRRGLTECCKTLILVKNVKIREVFYLC